MRVVLYGVGDLGERAAYLLAAVLQTSDTLVVAGRHAHTVHQVAHEADPVSKVLRAPYRPCLGRAARHAGRCCANHPRMRVVVSTRVSSRPWLINRRVPAGYRTHVTRF